MPKPDVLEPFIIPESRFDKIEFCLTFHGCSRYKKPALRQCRLENDLDLVRPRERPDICAIQFPEKCAQEHVCYCNRDFCPKQAKSVLLTARLGNTNITQTDLGLQPSSLHLSTPSAYSNTSSSLRAITYCAGDLSSAGPGSILADPYPEAGGNAWCQLIWCAITTSDTYLFTA